MTTKIHHHYVDSRSHRKGRKAAKKALNKAFRKRLRLNLEEDCKVHKGLTWILL